jgi:hypothetical protein
MIVEFTLVTGIVLVVGFVAGVLVGRNNATKVNTAIAALQKDVTTVKAVVAKDATVVTADVKKL